ncbi:MFS general substrate transporter [Melanomma pulvis-pyrius CBS 109.77]|uniref:MFS general substrate transporter n=1 Tax=Melanomma pulvis-pyrius CBS 109.77 TaxID=1314802 RepID=A0A6A6XBN9_9PLEO|nr:MFS general substrate transporter [Melanomma pulvis-pyrius CBS 109.77]
MVWDIIRDSTFGHLVRLASKGKYFQYTEEHDSLLWKNFIKEEQSAIITQHRDSNTPEDGSELPLRDTQRPVSTASSRTQLPEEDSTQRSEASGVRVDPEKGRDKHVIDWLGQDDPDSTGKKFFVTFEVCFLTFNAYIGSAIYTAGIVAVMRVFNVSQVAATLGLTLYVAGYGLGPMVWAPMSEVPFIGRNPIYIGTLFVFVMFQIPTALASNFGMLLAFRFLTGLFGSPALATGGASIADMYTSRKQASTNILYRRTRRLRKITGNDRLTCKPEIMAEEMTGKDIALMVLIRPISLNFTEPMVFLLNLYIALIYGLLYIWFESFPIVFVEIYGFNLGQEGLAFLGLLIGALVTLVGLFSWLYFYQENQFNENGELQPEKRLPPAMVGGFFVPICLFWFGWSACPSIHRIMPIVGSGFFTVAAFLLFNAVLPYLSDAYPEYTASVFASNDLMRSAFGAGFPLFANAMYRRLGIGWASSTLAFLGIAFIPIPYVLYIYGQRLRQMSRHARKDI